MNTPTKPKSRPLLTEQQAAEYLNLAVRTLQQWRVQGKGPKFIKLSRAVRYRQSDLEDYISSSERTHTA
ncbi:AlpA family transcriptional regulator [Methylosinus sp. KRF6]|uniref:helix-turn-helix transcriptional regulator n=1 Tax=Methylosinus sp. KRF6 TaxID=2846853 RepID=UPI001C0CF809|nr:helix-turn-helix domain-containing protein [Methylosinus sp. KRF6]MBU3887215.1 helix-turn-helix domain-containing protein [Methylosinus sp. KRF6]